MGRYIYGGIVGVLCGISITALLGYRVMDWQWWAIDIPAITFLLALPHLVRD